MLGRNVIERQVGNGHFGSMISAAGSERTADVLIGIQAGHVSICRSAG